MSDTTSTTIDAGHDDTEVTAEHVEMEGFEAPPFVPKEEEEFTCSTEPDNDSSDDNDDEMPETDMAATKQTDAPTTRRSRILTMINVFKYTMSSALILFCLYVVTAAIFTKQTTATGEFEFPSWAAFVIFWILILWLSLMEGALNCMVGLQPIDKALYADSHHITTRCTLAAHKGDNMERFIVGRQFLDLMSVFMVSFLVSSIDNASLPGLPDSVTRAFLDSGLAVILVTIVFGQLTTQINAAYCMLDFINNYVMLFTTYAALILEASGLLHAVYLVQIVVSHLAGKPVESKEPHRTKLQKVLFWVRVFVSVGILILALVVTFMAMYNGATTMWASVPFWASVLILVFLILLGGLMEAMQIALFAVIHLPPGEVDSHHHRAAYRNCKLLYKAKNLQSFLIGRQIFQTVIMFVIARITTMDSGHESLSGLPEGLQKFFNTGVVGALISTILASLSWRVLACSFPIVFLDNPLAVLIIRFCLLLEYSGICSSAWLVAYAQKWVIGYKKDELYIGTAESRHAHEGTMKEVEEGDLRLTQMESGSSSDDER